MGGHGAVLRPSAIPTCSAWRGCTAPSIRGGTAPRRTSGLTRAPSPGVTRSPWCARRTWLAAPRSGSTWGRTTPGAPGRRPCARPWTRRAGPTSGRSSPGEHDGWYWGDHLWEYLPYYGRAFRAAGHRPVTRNPCAWQSLGPPEAPKSPKESHSPCGRLPAGSSSTGQAGDDGRPSQSPPPTRKPAHPGWLCATPGGPPVTPPAT